MFNDICYSLNLIRLSWLAAALRLAVYALCPWGRRVWQYGHDVGGYLGGIDVAGVGTVAFRRADGALQWRW